MGSFFISPALREDYSNIIIQASSLPERPGLAASSDPAAKTAAQIAAQIRELLQDSGYDFFSSLASSTDGPAVSALAEGGRVDSATAEADRADSFIQKVNQQYSILYVPLSEHLSTVGEIGYPAVPKLFTEMNVVSLEAAGILPVRIRPSLDLSGAGVLVGILDSGIDYTHPAFRNADGTTRILRLWDQSDERGTPPDGISYGTEYTNAQINAALFSGNIAVHEEPSYPAPVQQDSQINAVLLPRTDPRGHGTAVAGIACGSAEAGEGFTGVAPAASIAFVRLKGAKQYLRDYFRIPDGAVAYQEDDLMLGVRYLLDCALRLGMPLVICVPLGSSQGGHTGHTPLENVLNAALYEPGICAVTGTGNELGYDHHYEGSLRPEKEFEDVELLIDEETNGFSVELWADAPDQYSLGFTSPLGETILPVPPAIGTSRDFFFLLENSRIALTWAAENPPDASFIILIRLFDPTPGIWRIRIGSPGYENGTFHLWLPAEGLVSPQIRFLASNADTTLVIPSCAPSVLGVGTWNAYDYSLYLHSGRGYTRNGLVKPDFVSPGVRVTCPASGGGYSSLTGSSASAALTAGAAALLMESGLKQNPARLFSASEIRDLILRGVRQSPSRSYPDKAWGWGILDVYGIFESLLT
ncbi:MAG: S8 family peptidase [Lachnospiraceae bacterium]|nr:S8 family peptidase [Lachnospiraceae bacterium]